MKSDFFTHYLIDKSTQNLLAKILSTTKNDQFLWCLIMQFSVSHEAHPGGITSRKLTNKLLWLLLFIVIICERNSFACLN